MSEAIVPGSIQDIANKSNQSLADTFLGVEIVALVDTSDSMGEMDSRGGRSRYDVACEELSNLQQANPGKVLVVSFSSQAKFCLNGVPDPYWQYTQIGHALEFVEFLDGVVRFVVISDGEPTDGDMAIIVASRMKSEINCIHVGPDDDHRAKDFLKRLAAKGRGKFLTAKAADLLAEQVTLLLKDGNTHG